ncbi:hypothetical protein AFK24_09805 [Pseudomonas syringae]|uniref:Uncharacterized protein n=1 Tax=Pseudomonas syringae TaxID=317 RepID=A0A1C7Z9T7_PSESX|nr:hypothetical protein AFK24_09805 [Pseudomonas syringae]
MYTMILFPGDTPCRQFNPRLVDDHWSSHLLHPARRFLGPAADLPPVLRNVPESRVTFGCDSFNSLAHLREQAFWAIATVLRVLSTGLQAAKFVALLRQL